MVDETSEFYKPVSLPEVSSKIVTEEREGSPFKKQLWHEAKGQRISPDHGRSIEEAMSAGKVIWADEYGNYFGSRSWKGAPIVTPVVERDKYSPRGLRVYGLKDVVGLTRIEKASRLMRQQGLATERVVETRRLEKIIKSGGKVVPVKKWKANQVAEYEKRARKNKIRGGEPKPEEIKKYLKGTEFYVLERETQVGERLLDLAELNMVLDEYVVLKNGKVGHEGKIYSKEEFVKRFEELTQKEREKKLATWRESLKGEPSEAEVKAKEEELTERYKELKKAVEEAKVDSGAINSGFTFKKTLGRIFNWVNVRNELMGKEERFDVNKKEDIRRYLGEYLPREMGRYLARFHRLGLAHGFATFHNWSAVGTLYDLDSVHGKPLGDNKAITDEEISRDIGLSVEGIGVYLQEGRQEIVKTNLPYGYKGFLSQSFGEIEAERMRNKAYDEFNQSYTHEWRRQQPATRLRRVWGRRGR